MAYLLFRLLDFHVSTVADDFAVIAVHRNFECHKSYGNVFGLFNRYSIHVAVPIYRNFVEDAHELLHSFFGFFYYRCGVFFSSFM